MAYDQAGLKQVVAHLRALAPALIVVEATVGLETRLVSALAATLLPVANVNPRQVRAFSHAAGILAKTDRLDVSERLSTHHAASLHYHE